MSSKGGDNSSVPAKAKPAEIEAFLRQVALAPKPVAGKGEGRLVFAMDATASRRPTWDEAQQVQSEMFRAVEGVGGLSVQLVFFRGMGECRASGWVKASRDLERLMRGVECVGGHTQIERVLRHTLAETREKRVNALVYVGDCLEEDADEIARRAGELALQGVPIFAFQEGDDAHARPVFQEMARITRGAYCAFDRESAAMLAELLAAVAVYAAGGYAALQDFSRSAGAETRRLIAQMR